MNKKRQLRDLALDAAPFAVLGLDADGTVIMINAQLRNLFGTTSRDVGRPFHDLEISYRPIELRSLIEQTYVEHRTIRVSSVERRMSSDDVQYLDIQIQPLWGSDGLSAGTLLMFFDTTITAKLELELKSSREDLDTASEELQSTNEELETTSEELQSSIEELETTNVELQSTNEELQSGNQELEIMNEEMRARAAELDEARTFLEGVLFSVAAAVVVLDRDLLVRSWNRGAEELWGLRAHAVQHQAFFNLAFGLPTGEVRGIVQECLATGQRTGPVQLPAINRIGRSITCTVTCSPLRSNGDGEGAVLLMEEANRH